MEQLMSALPPDHQLEQNRVGASEEAAEVSRRGAFKRLAGWSKAAIAAVMFGTTVSDASAKERTTSSGTTSSGTKPQGGGWINGGGWVNRTGGWINGGGGGGWVNRR
jgi:hypothetical protein